MEAGLERMLRICIVREVCDLPCLAFAAQDKCEETNVERSSKPKLANFTVRQGDNLKSVR